MNWWEEKWFTTLPEKIKQNYYSAYNHKFINDSDIDELKKLPRQTHAVIQTVPLNAYSQSIQNMRNLAVYRNFNRAAEIQQGNNGEMEHDPLMKAMINQMSSVGKVAKEGGTQAQMVGTAAISMIHSMRSFGNSTAEFVFGTFFECFKQKYFNEPIQKYVKPKARILIKGTCRDLFIMFAIVNNMKDNKINYLNITSEAFINNITQVIYDTYNSYAIDMAKNLWDVKPPDNILITIGRQVTDTVFSLTKYIQNSYNIQTYKILVPSIKLMGENEFNDINVIMRAINNTIGLVGRKENNNEISCRWKDDGIKFIMTYLQEAEQKIRDECINSIKDTLMKTTPSSNVTNESFQKFINNSLFDKLVINSIRSQIVLKEKDNVQNNQNQDNQNRDNNNADIINTDQFSDGDDGYTELRNLNWQDVSRSLLKHTAPQLIGMNTSGNTGVYNQQASNSEQRAQLSSTQQSILDQLKKLKPEEIQTIIQHINIK